MKRILLTAFGAMALAFVTLAVFDSKESLAAYEVNGLEITTYYTPLESFYTRTDLVYVNAWKDYSTTGTKVKVGPYPRSFVNHTKGEGTGKITSGVHAGKFLNWSWEGLGPNGDQQGFWLDTCPRDSYGGCLVPKVSAAVSENLANNFGMTRGKAFKVTNCGTEEANTQGCSYYKSGNWVVSDEFTTGIASDKQIDLYYGIQDFKTFRSSNYWLTMYDARVAVQ